MKKRRITFSLIFLLFTTILLAQENATLSLGANSSTDLTIKANGNIGIVDETPQFRLVVKGKNYGGVLH